MYDFIISSPGQIRDQNFTECNFKVKELYAGRGKLKIVNGDDKYL